MKKSLVALCLMLMVPMILFSQTYSSLWKQAEKASHDDLPETEQKVLRQIVKKAEKERAYGHLLKAELKAARVQCEVAPDSLSSLLDQLKARLDAAADRPALQAVYSAVLGYIYEHNITSLEERHEQVARDYYALAMAHPEQLAAVRATDYEPLVEKGSDSERFFANDLLSLLARETGRYDVARDYYLAAGNRRAALLMTLWALDEVKDADEYQPYATSTHIAQLDSIIEAYADLPEVGEAVLKRFSCMDEKTDATPAQKWDYIEKVMSRFTNWPRLNTLRNRQHSLSTLQFEASFDRLTIPNRQQTVYLNDLRGINELTLRVYKADVQGDVDYSPNNSEDYKKLKPLLHALPAHTKTVTFAAHEPYETFEDSVVLDGLPVGVYLVEAESKPATRVSRQFYFVSDVRVLSLGLPGNQLRFAVVNATTGQPVGGATLQLTTGYGKRKKTTTLTMNRQGETVYSYDDERPNQLFVYTKTDKACPPTSNIGHYDYYEHGNDRKDIAIYTDRAIYRPGQTVHVAAILSATKNGRDYQVEAGKQVTIRLRDANYQEVSQVQVTTDQYGTCSTDFTLPRRGLTGHFTIQVDNHSTGIRVEEYKRPTFELEMPEIKTNYRDGDTVTVEGIARSYAGVPVQGATVKYKVERRRAFWWLSYSRYWDFGAFGSGSDDEELLSGEAVTDQDGRFTVDVPMLLPKTKYTMFYNFVVTADVTDQGGETHQGSLSLPLGNRDAALSCSLPDQVLAERVPDVAFYLRNAAGNNVPATVRYRIDSGKWYDTTTEAASSPLTAQLSSLKSGRHTLEATCEGDTIRQSFVVFSLDDKRPATETDDWFYQSDYQFPNDGKPVTLQVGSSAKDVHMVYAIFAGSKIIEEGAVDQSNALFNRKLTYRDDYGDALLLAFAWAKDGKLYQHTATISRPMPDKTLRLQWQTFRDRLTPGQQEEWTLTVVNPDGSPADAQLLATLYDKSLDQLQRMDWQLNPYVSLNMPYTLWQFGKSYVVSCSGVFTQKNLPVGSLYFSHLNHEVYPCEFYRPRRGLVRYKMMSRANADMDMLEEPVMLESKAADDGAVLAIEVNGVARQPKKAMTAGAVPTAALADEAVAESEEEEADGGEQGGGQPVQMRENLQETAFFYPQLATDSLGRVVLKFTLPESLTTWRFQGIAHTADMLHGVLGGEAVAQKDVMIQPNMPRFVRLGDEATISARIFNTSGRELSGTARLQLLDPETEQVVYEQKQEVLLTANSTFAVTFPVVCRNESQSLLIAKVMVSGATFSDGEQHYLPVLSNSERVTVSVPFTQNEPGTKTIDLTQIIPQENTSAVANSTLNTQHSTLTVEYTNNPAWLMIQALPAVGHPHDDCAICQATSFYANSIGRHILSQNPTAKHVFELWKQEDASATTLDSQLEKDQELKELLLNETPWVLDANRESEQRQRLADFFDQNLMDQRLSSAIDKLKKLQNADGSWSWWPGMHSSFYVTMEVSEMLVRLNEMTGRQQDTEKMLNGSFGYLGDDIVRLVDEMKKEEKRGHKQTFPSFKALQWLYICALDGRQLPAKVRDANAYLTNLLKKETKNQTLYEKALSAIILSNKTYVKSLKEWTVYKEEMGRYYDSPRAGYSWRNYRIPTQVAAIEALKRLTPDDTQTISEMQRWLLQEKRTQSWDTPINSVEAIYAFLNGRSQVLAPQEKTVLKVDDQPVETSAATAGLGYVKTTMPAQGVKTFTAEKTSTGTSWGAVYAQFIQPTTEIKDQQSGISVKREIFISRSSDRTSAEAGNVQCKVGDRITVRLTIVADRDYDFVQVVDKRAACLEPVNQLSGYNWREGYYCTPRDATTNYYFDVFAKGRHVIETEYYVDRPGRYETGTCIVECAYSPEFRGLTHAQTVVVEQ